MKLVNRITLLIALLLLSACSFSPKNPVAQTGDDQLTKQQIVAELSKLDKAEKEINSKKDLTAKNTAFLFWWPGMTSTHTNANEALKLVEQRRSHLTALYNQKYASTDRAKQA